MVQLSQHYDGQTLSRLDELSQRESVSANFLVQILNDLKRGGLIISKRGKAGGYILASEPRQISLLEITHAVEPAMLAISTSNEGESGQPVNLAWEKLNEGFQKELKSITLDTLSDQSPMFYI